MVAASYPPINMELWGNTCAVCASKRSLWLLKSDRNAFVTVGSVPFPYRSFKPANGKGRKWKKRSLIARS